MVTIVHDIAEFHRVGSVPAESHPGFPSEDRIALRESLIEEEVGETLSAIRSRDLLEVADGIVDSIVVLVGTALEFGIPLTRVWDEVHFSNMSKFPKCSDCNGGGCATCDGRGRIVLRREDGKILKPSSWSPPEISKALFPFFEGDLKELKEHAKGRLDGLSGQHPPEGRVYSYLRGYWEGRAEYLKEKDLQEYVKGRAEFPKADPTTAPIVDSLRARIASVLQKPDAWGDVAHSEIRILTLLEVFLMVQEGTDSNLEGVLERYQASHRAYVERDREEYEGGFLDHLKKFTEMELERSSGIPYRSVPS